MVKKIYPRQIWQEIKKFINSKEAIVITGMRRTGKTSLLNFIFQQIKSKNKLFFDLENPLNRKIFSSPNYESIKRILEKKGLDFSKRHYLFLDEIQFLQHVPSVAKYFIDHYNTKLFLTGSASFYLKNLFSESLAGRKYIFEIFPLSFEEFLTFKEINIRKPKITEKIDENLYLIFEPYWQEYLEYGAFPEVVLKNTKEEKERKLQEIYSSYFQKEIEQLSDFRKKNKLHELITLLAENTGNLLDIEKLSRELQVSRLTIEEWIYFLEATYIISLIPPFSKKKRIEIRKRKKVYFIDWGLAKAIAEISKGQVFENCIFHLLRIKNKKINFYRKKTGEELDFILDKKTAVECKLSVDEKEIRKYKKLVGNLGLKNLYFATYNYKNFYHNYPEIKPGFVL